MLLNAHLSLKDSYFQNVRKDSLFELVNSISSDTGSDIPEVFDDIINAVSAALYLSLATGSITINLSVLHT